MKVKVNGQWVDVPMLVTNGKIMPMRYKYNGKWMPIVKIKGDDER